jgi:hypothetical protein
MIDFERDVYPGGVGAKNPSPLRPGVKISNGLFYTLHKTDSQFVLHPPASSGKPDKELGSVAEVVAANIYLQTGGSVTLSGGPFVLPQPLIALPGLTYQIDITNNCNRAKTGCNYNKSANTKEERNDFYLYYETFTLPANEPEYELICTMPKRPRKDIGICVERHTERAILMTDDAPCGAVGFGQSPPP